MNELERLQRAYDAIDEPGQETVAAARKQLLAEIASAELKSLAGNGRPQPVSFHGHRAHRRRRLGLIAVAAVILLSVLLVTPAVGIGSRLLELLEGPGTRPRPPADVGAPVWSPDGRRIAFEVWRGRTFDAYVVNADGGGQRSVITGSSGGGHLLDWSPDGRKLAFASSNKGNPGIYVMNADGSGLLRMTRGGASGPRWSPNGRKLAFEKAGGIVVMRADGTGQRNVTRSAAMLLAWSPAGRRIAFARSVSGRGFGQEKSIFVVNVDGSGQRRLTPDGVNFGGWSPDGQQIVFARPQRGKSEIHMASVDGSALRNLTRDWGLDELPVWSPSGRMIAFARSVSGRGFASPDALDREVFVMRADGSGRRRLTHTTRGASGPSWSPDGRRIAFQSSPFPDGRTEIYVVNADGTGQRRLTRSTGWDDFPVWSPDGRTIAFVSNREGRSEVFVMNADGSNQRRLTQLG